MVRDADSGKYRRTRLFVLTLGYSRKSVRLLVFRSSARVWAEPARESLSTPGWFDAGGWFPTTCAKPCCLPISTIPI